MGSTLTCKNCETNEKSITGLFEKNVRLANVIDFIMHNCLDFGPNHFTYYDSKERLNVRLKVIDTRDAINKILAIIEAGK